MADYIITNSATIRETAAKFGCCKTIAHQKITSLRESDPSLYRRVKAVLDKNFEDKSSRGGKAVWDKYHKTPHDKISTERTGTA